MRRSRHRLRKAAIPTPHSIQGVGMCRNKQRGGAQATHHQATIRGKRMTA